MIPLSPSPPPTSCSCFPPLIPLIVYLYGRCLFFSSRPQQMLFYVLRSRSLRDLCSRSQLFPRLYGPFFFLFPRALAFRCIPPHFAGRKIFSMIFTQLFPLLLTTPYSPLNHASVNVLCGPYLCRVASSPGCLSCFFFSSEMDPECFPSLWFI